MRKLSRLLSAAALAALMCEPAFAHSPSPGLQGFWSGALHLLMDPVQLLMIAAYCFWFGQFSLDVIRPRLVAVVLAALAGTGIGLSGLNGGGQLLFGLASVPEPAVLGYVSLGVAVVAALAGALLPGASKVLLVPLGMGVGALVGYVNVPEPGSVSALAMTILGSAATFLYIVIGGTVGLEYLLGKYTQPWARIAVRTLCAWVATISFIILAFQLVGKG